jgi:hypothetical protein
MKKRSDKASKHYHFIRNFCPFDGAWFGGKVCYKCKRNFQDSSREAWIDKKVRPDIMGTTYAKRGRK